MTPMVQEKATRGSKSAPLAVTQMVREWIREQERAGRKPGEIAKELGVTRTQVVNVRDETRGVGAKMEEGFARVRFGGSIDTLRRVARGESVGAPTQSEQTYIPAHLEDDELTRRVAEYAIEVEGLSQEAVDQVLSTLPGGTGGERLEPADLLDEIRFVDRRLKRADRRQGETEVTDELD